MNLDDITNRINTLEQKVDQLTELLRAIVQQLPPDAQSHIAWKLVNDWVNRGNKREL